MSKVNTKEELEIGFPAKLSCRTALTAVSASALAASTASTSAANRDLECEAHLHWTAIDTRREAIWEEWGALERALAARHPDFFRLTKEQRGLLPDGGPRMAEIEIEGYRLLQRRFELLPKLCRMRCRTADALLARLGVIRLLADPEGSAELSQLIDRAFTDLRGLQKQEAI